MLERLFDRADAKDRPPRNCVQLPDDPWSVVAANAAIAAAKAAEQPEQPPTWGAAIRTWLRARVR